MSRKDLSNEFLAKVRALVAAEYGEGARIFIGISGENMSDAGPCATDFPPGDISHALDDWSMEFCEEEAAA